MSFLNLEVELDPNGTQDSQDEWDDYGDNCTF
jgi:hypothetical protein